MKTVTVSFDDLDMLYGMACAYMAIKGGLGVDLTEAMLTLVKINDKVQANVLNSINHTLNEHRPTKAHVA